MARRCEGWSSGEAFIYAIDRSEGAGLRKAAGESADRYEERVSAVEKPDGSELTYQARTRHNARVTATQGKARLAAAGGGEGELAATYNRFTQKAALPPGTLGPVAARARLVEALAANRPGTFELRTVDILRFHRPLTESFLRLEAGDPAIEASMPEALRDRARELAGGRVWAVRRRALELNEFGDELWVVHESGAIVRQIVQRQGLRLILDARELSIFPDPRCG